MGKQILKWIAFVFCFLALCIEINAIIAAISVGSIGLLIFYIFGLIGWIYLVFFEEYFQEIRDWFKDKISYLCRGLKNKHGSD